MGLLFNKIFQENGISLICCVVWRIFEYFTLSRIFFCENVKMFYIIHTSSSSFRVARGTADVNPAFLLVAAIV